MKNFTRGTQTLVMGYTFFFGLQHLRPMHHTISTTHNSLPVEDDSPSNPTCNQERLQIKLSTRCIRPFFTSELDKYASRTSSKYYPAANCDASLISIFISLPEHACRHSTLPHTCTTLFSTQQVFLMMFGSGYLDEKHGKL